MEWSAEDHKRARAEGWSYINGVVLRTFRPDGTAVFAGPGAVIEHIITQAETSEWHQQVYYALPWTGCEQHAAIIEGWLLTSQFTIAHTVLGFKPSKFATPQEAHAHVIKRAQESSLMHAKALAQVAKHRLING